MLKEIFAQPDAIRGTLWGRVDRAKGVTLEYEIGPAEIFKAMKHVVIIGCGSSRHAALVGKYLIESFARLQVDVDYASEFQYRDPLLTPNTMIVVLTQPREISDTVGAIEKARDKGAFVLLVSHVADSRATRMADSILFTSVNQENCAASTNAFTTQLVRLYLLGLFLANARRAMSLEEISRRLRLLNRVPEQVERVLESNLSIEALAWRFCDYSHATYVGQGINFPIALEGAFMLKQLSYLRAEACPSAEIKYDPIALADKTTPVIVLAPHDNMYQETLSTLEEVRARDGPLFVIATEGDRAIAERTNYFIQIPEADALLNPFLTVVPLQLLAYHIGAVQDINANQDHTMTE